MKLKPSYVTMATLALSVLVWLSYSYGIFTRYNYFTAQWDKHKGTLQLLTYGEELTVAKQQKRVAQEMGFRMKAIAGCIISSNAINGADAYNAVMTQALNSKLGKNWKVGFDRRADSLFRADSKSRIYQAVMQKTDVSELKHKCDSAKRGRVFVKVINPVDPDPTHPNAWVCHEVNRKFEVIAYYRVDPYTLTVKRILY